MGVNRFSSSITLLSLSPLIAGWDSSAVLDVFRLYGEMSSAA